jgi:hypothetical protein
VCNKPVPIFSLTSTTPPDQYIKTPLQIGQTGQRKELRLFGNFTLSESNPGTAAISRAAMDGEAINVASTGAVHTINAVSSTANQYAVFGNGTGGAGGLSAKTDSGTALYAINTGVGSSLAALLEGNVKIGSAAKTGDLTLVKGNLTVAQGNVSINGSLTVNGQQYGTADLKQVTLAASIAPNSNRTFTATEITGSSNPYRMVSYVVTSAISPATRVYKQFTDTTNIFYTECTLASFIGSLRINNTNGVNPLDVRVLVSYKNDAVDCSNADTVPPVVYITSPTNNQNVVGVVSVNYTATDTVGVIKTELYVNGVLHGTADTVAPFDTLPFTSTSFTDSPPQYSLVIKAYDAAGNIGTSNPVYVNVVNNAGGTPCGILICSGATPKCCCSERCEAGPICGLCI